MSTLLLLTTIFGVSIQSVSIKAYGNKTGAKGRFIYLAISRLAGVIFLSCTAGSLCFEPKIIPYAVLFGLFYSVCAVFSFLSINSGPLTLTSLITSYSLMLPTAYGLIFLKDPISKGFYPGLIFLLISLMLINKKTSNSGVKITPKWILFVLITFLANGGCSIIQTIQRNAFKEVDGMYRNEFMIIAFLLFVTVTLVLSLFTEREDIPACAKKGWLLAIICGVANAVVNLLTMVLQSYIPVSVLFPLVSAGGLVLTYFLSRFLYKEKLSLVQNIGFILGVISVICLNI